MNPSILIAIALGVSSAVTVHAVPSPPAAEVKPPGGVDPKLSSADPEYGYSQKKPVKVGNGPSGERAYFSTLLDEAGQPVKFSRLGSYGPGPDGNILDGYEVKTSTGRTLTIYIDMYHAKNDPRQQLAPKGLFKAK